MTTKKLEINPNFFNKLDSLYKGKTNKITTNLKVNSPKVNSPKIKKTFGSTPISVISENKKEKIVHIPDNTQTQKKTINTLNDDIISSSDFTSKSDNLISSDEEFEIIEKRKPKKKRNKKRKRFRKEINKQEINNSFHLYDDDYSAHIVAKLDKRHPLYHKLINLPYNELINISYNKKNNTKYFDTLLVICFMSGLLIGITMTFSILH